jgi:Uma2 family endonuclease
MSVMLSPPLETTEQVTQEHHWTVEEFYRAYEAGEFGYSKNWELTQGRITEKMPPGFHHAALADIIAQMLRDNMQPAFIVREEKPVQLSADSQLIPDITVVRGARADYLNHHPAPEEVVVLVEVADTTVVKDLGEKALQYAQADISDYWVVLAEAQAIVVHRQPSPEGYQDVVRLVGTDTLSPLAMPQARWTINELLGRSEASEEN